MKHKRRISVPKFGRQQSADPKRTGLDVQRRPDARPPAAHPAPTVKPKATSAKSGRRGQ